MDTELRQYFDNKFEKLIETVATKKDLGVIQLDLTVLKEDVGDLKTDVSVLKKDVSALKSDVGVLKTDVSVLKTDVSILKTEMIEVKNSMVTHDDLPTLNIATKDDLTELRDGLVSVLASKADVLEVKAIVNRLDLRTDQDTRANIKEVNKIKVTLKNRGLNID